MKVIRNMHARWNNLNPSTRAVVKGVTTAAVVGTLTVASAADYSIPTGLDYGGIMNAGKSEVTASITGAGPQMAALAGMVGGAGWILRKLFGI